MGKRGAQRAIEDVEEARPKLVPASPSRERLEAVRRRMRDAGVDLLWVRSTDRWLNEYVPTEESARVWISGFTGSMGEVVIAHDKAFLIVDGRYWLQAENETDPGAFEVVKVPLATGYEPSVAELLGKLTAALAERGAKVVIGYEPAKVTPAELEGMKKSVPGTPSWKGLFPSPVEAARGPAPSAKPGSRHGGKLRAIDEKKVGATVQDKLAAIAGKLEQLEIDALLVQRLDEIAWLSNLRSDELPYQATFKSVALVTRDRLFIGMDPSRAPNEVRRRREAVLFVPEAELWTLIGRKTKRLKIGFDKTGTTEQGRLMIETTGAVAIAVESPIGALKARKNPSELKAMVEAFRRADRVIDEAQKWLCQEVVGKKRVTEADFAEHVRAGFEASGATGLSFRIISAAGKNGAIIHYSNPSAERVIKRGELMLLDTGAYYDEGYATDLTRTFLVDAPDAEGNEKQRYYFTMTLKAAIAGMSAVIPAGARGSQLDAIVRAPLWKEGLDYNHGTGHGVGVNVHEAPPRIGPTSQGVLEEGYVFSIEPGVYLPAFGGIRIENLCTLVPAPKRPGFLAVEPLTFSPLDKRLIDDALLTPGEREWLASFAKQWKG